MTRALSQDFELVVINLLEMETGRHSRPKTPVEQRLCQNCGANKIEDEVYFLTECFKYSHIVLDGNTDCRTNFVKIVSIRSVSGAGHLY